MGLLAAAAPLAAQSGPGIITNVASDPVFNSTNLASIYDTNGTIRNIVQINFTKSHPSDTAGRWTVTLSVYDLSATYGGGAGSHYVVMGQYDTTGTKPKFTPSTLGNNMNNVSKAPCFGLMIEPRDGLYAAVGWVDGAYLSWRKDNQTAFPAPVKITAASSATPTPARGYWTAAPGYVDKQLKLFYANFAGSIMMQDIKPTFTNNVLTKAEVQGTAVPVANLSITPHSPTPIIDKSGEVRGLWMGGSSGSDSDMYFMPSLNMKDTPIKLFDDTRWMGNGGVAGGKLFFANSANGTSASVAEVAWLVGSNTTIGGTATMTLGCRNPKGTVLVISRVALSLKLNAGTRVPVPIPGWNGGFALAAPIFIFSTLVGLGRDEVAHWSRAVPNDNTLKGLRVAVQGLSTPRGVGPTLTNTATLEFK